MQGQFASLLSFSARPCVILCDLMTEESPLVWHPGCVMQQRRGHWHKEYLVFKLEWVAMPFSRGPSQPDRTQVSYIAGGFFTICATREAQGT